MKTLIVLILLIGSMAQAEEFKVQMLGDEFTFKGKLVVAGGTFELQDVVVSLPGSGDYLIDTDGGWGAMPLDEVCEQISGGKYNHADSYGNMIALGFFNWNDLIIFTAADGGRAESYKIVKKSEHSRSIYYQNLECRTEPSNY